jgi:hypothetical protein
MTHFSVEALGDAVVVGEAPHADDPLGPLAQGLCEGESGLEAALAQLVNELEEAAVKMATDALVGLNPIDCPKDWSTIPLKRNVINPTAETSPYGKECRGGRMTAAKRRAAKSRGGKGLVKNRPAGRNIMRT